jgi:hypothetical protein
MLYYPHFDASGSVGSLLPNCNAKLVDENGKDITGFEVRGELCVRVPLLFQSTFRMKKQIGGVGMRKGIFILAMLPFVGTARWASCGILLTGRRFVVFPGKAETSRIFFF